MTDVTIGGHWWTARLGVDTADTDHRLCIGYGGNGGGWRGCCSRSRAKWRQSREETIVRTLLRCPLQRRNLWLSQHYNTNMLLMLLSEAGNAAAGINPNDFWSNKIGQVNAFLEKTGRWRRWRRWKLALVLTLNIVNSPRANLKASSICWMVKCIVDIDENWISKNQ